MGLGRGLMVTSLATLCGPPQKSVADYRTHVSRINHWFLQAARTLAVVQVDIVALLDGRILVWHMYNQKHSGQFATRPSREEHLIREPVSSLLSGAKRKLARELPCMAIRGSQHSSVVDVRTTILLLWRRNTERDHIVICGTVKKIVVNVQNWSSNNPGRKARKASKGKKKGKMKVLASQIKFDSQEIDLI